METGPYFWKKSDVSGRAYGRTRFIGGLQVRTPWTSSISRRDQALPRGCALQQASVGQSRAGGMGCLGWGVEGEGLLQTSRSGR
jgi:hypothetical protein